MDQAATVTVERLTERKAELEGELAKGQALLQRQQAAMEQTQATLMRIQGALTMLGELLAGTSTDPEIVSIEQVRRSKDGKGSDAEVPTPLS